MDSESRSVPAPWTDALSWIENYLIYAIYTDKKLVAAAVVKEKRSSGVDTDFWAAKLVTVYRIP